MAEPTPPVVTLPDGSTGPLTIRWDMAGITSEATITSAIAGSGGRILLIQDEREVHDAQGRPRGRTNVSVAWGRLTPTGVRFHHRIPPGTSAARDALEPLLTFERTMELLAATDPHQHLTADPDLRAHTLTCALASLPAGPARELGVTLVRTGFTGTPQDLLHAIAAAVDAPT